MNGVKEGEREGDTNVVCLEIWESVRKGGKERDSMGDN